MESLTKIHRLYLELAAGELTVQAAVLEVAVAVSAREVEAAGAGLVEKFIIFSLSR